MTTKSDVSLSNPLREECERAMHAIFATLDVPRSYLDLDCSHGFMVRAARMFGCKPAIGRTLDPRVKRECKRYANLVLGYVIGQYDLVTCLRLPPFARIENMLSDGGHLVVASAFPNGKGAVNGLVYEADATTDLQSVWSNVAQLLPLYVQVYRK